MGRRGFGGELPAALTLALLLVLLALLRVGHPQYGQLGHGTDGEYIDKQGKTDCFQTSPLASILRRDPETA